MARGEDGMVPAVVLVAGTRPELLKLAPIEWALRRRGMFIELWLTGQHGDLAPPFVDELGLAARILPVAESQGCITTRLARFAEAIARRLVERHPRMMLVQGDTLSSLAGGLAAAYRGIPLGHVEAGLRTLDLAQPFPEELNRQLLARMACLHFAPTMAAVAALAAEQVDRRTIHLTGNTAIDTLLATKARLDDDPKLGSALGRRFPFADRPFALATVHRRESQGEALDGIARAFAKLAAEGLPVVLPLHPNPLAGGWLKRRLEGASGVHLLPPLDHRSLVWLLSRARLLMTDSGGLQEEAPALGLPTLVLRETTERPEAVECGVARLVGTSTAAITRAAAEVLSSARPAPAFPFGDGRAGERIAAIVERHLEAAALETAA